MKQFLNMLNWLVCGAMLFCFTSGSFADDVGKKNIVIIAGKKSHGPEGNGIHDYPWSAKLIKVMLDNSNIAEKVNVVYYRDGWPKELDVLEVADTIMVISDGRDGDLYEEAPHIQTEDRIKFMRRRMKEGCGLVTFHFSTFAPDRLSREVLNWTGGYFDWADDQGRKNWYSAIKVQDTDLEISDPDHPALRGVKPFKMKEEFYYNIRFAEGDKGLTPLLNVPTLEGRPNKGNVVAWARQREGGGRGFSTTCGHFYKNWEHEHFRRMVLNALVWTAHVEVPDDGVHARFYSHEEITAALGHIGEGRAKPAVYDDQPMNVLIVTGNEAHKWHNWEKSTPRVKASIEQDPRIKTDVIYSFDELGERDLSGVDVLVLNNFCNWHDPNPPSDDAKKAYLGFLERGGGLVLIHFSNGAFHYSLPKASESDWPRYREAVRRRWNHMGPAAARSGHDAFKKFEVRPTDRADMLIDGIKSFSIVDELYFKQHGDKPIEPLLVARSSVTGNDEPLAWRYNHGDARVFQTLLGHSEQTWNSPELREILRRAVAWTADRPVIKRIPANLPAPWEKEAAEGASSLSDAFGKGLTKPVVVKSNDSLRDPPITVELFAKLNSKNTFNVMLASDTKASSRHWELYSFANSGHFSLYLPGTMQGEVRTNIDIADSKWHYLAMQYERDRVRLYVDGKLAKDQKLSWHQANHVDGDFALGRIVEGQFAIDGVIDSVRISRGVLPINSVPDKPLERRDDTIALWHFEGNDQEIEQIGKKGADERMAENDPAVLPANEGLEGGKFGHWGKKNDTDWKDARWNDMNVGPFFCGAIDIPGGTITRGLAIRLGDEGNATLLYDTKDMTCRAGWTGAFIIFGPTRFGLIEHPQAGGDVKFINIGKSAANVQYRGLRVHGRRVVLDYTMMGRDVSESPWIEIAGGVQWFTRTIDVAAGREGVTIPLFQTEKSEISTRRMGDTSVLIAREQNHATVATVIGGSRLVLDAADGVGRCVIVGAQQPQTLKVAVWHGPVDGLTNALESLKQIAQPRSLATLRKPGPLRWGQPIATKGEVSTGAGMFLIDTITVPYENPHNALMFLSGVDFFSNGDAAVSTIHGDVWLVRGINKTLEKVTWQRFATGMFQPLGLSIRDDEVYVRCRDQITKLIDHNNDGEADEYLCFSQHVSTTPGGHDYVTELRQDAEGNFYYADPRGVHRISADGQKKHTLATGFRNPNGMGVGPDGMVTVAPQEGEWTPASMIHEIKDGGYYGFGGPKKTADRPLGYDLPLVYLPRLVDNSSGSQVWVTSKQWGALNGRMLNLSFGRSSMQLILRDKVSGQPQGAVVPIEGRFLSGVHRGTFNKNDGHFYVVGTQGWVTNAIKDGCFQRVRYTGKPMTLPVGLQAHENGVRIDFAVPLNFDIASDIGSYAVEQWNYKYARTYGSKEYSVKYPESEGHDKVKVAAAYVSTDGNTVFLEIPDIRPVDQMDISGLLEAQDGTLVPLQMYATIHELRPAFDTRSMKRMDPGDAPIEGVGDAPGLVMSIKDDAGIVMDRRVSRMAAMYVPNDESPTVFSKHVKYQVEWSGNINLDRRTSRRFHVEGTGRAEIFIDGKKALTSPGDGMGKARSDWVTLAKGKRPIRIIYEPPADADAEFRLYWRGREFADEPVPPTVFSHDSSDVVLKKRDLLRRARVLVAERGCLNCHQPNGGIEQWAAAMPELTARPTPLTDVGQRWNESWIASWLLDPQQYRPDARMPRMLEGNAFADDRARLKAAADIAAFLVQGEGDGEKSTGRAPVFKDDAIEQGRSLYAQLACISCHTLPSDVGTNDEHDRVPLSHIAQKWKHDALVRFLQNPSEISPDTRMPNFSLTEEESRRIAAYLLSASARRTPQELGTKGDPDVGRMLVGQLGCANCHDVNVKNDLQAVSLEQLCEIITPNKGCLAENNGGRSPQFDLNDVDSGAIIALLSEHATSLKRDNAAEYASRQITTLRCVNCHSYDGRPSVYDAVNPQIAVWLPDVEAEPENEYDDYDTDLNKKIEFKQQTWPTLTHAGDQFHTDWMASFIAGDVGEHPRPWLYTRMPAFKAQAERLATGLSHEHGRPTVRTHQDPPSQEQIAVGRQLFGVEQGLSCVQCHRAGSNPALMKHEFGAIDLVTSRQRLLQEFYLRWSLDPQRISPLTPMPDFAGADGKTPLGRHYEGDAMQQFNAIWAYLESVAPVKSPNELE